MAKSVAPNYFAVWSAHNISIFEFITQSNNVCKVGPPICYFTTKMQHFFKEHTLNFKHTILCNLTQAFWKPCFNSRVKSAFANYLFAFVNYLIAMWQKVSLQVIFAQQKSYELAWLYRYTQGVSMSFFRIMYKKCNNNAQRKCNIFQENTLNCKEKTKHDFLINLNPTFYAFIWTTSTQSQVQRLKRLQEKRQLEIRTSNLRIRDLDEDIFYSWYKNAILSWMVEENLKLAWTSLQTINLDWRTDYKKTKCVILKTKYRIMSTREDKQSLWLWNKHQLRLSRWSNERWLCSRGSKRRTAKLGIC